MTRGKLGLEQGMVRRKTLVVIVIVLLMAAVGWIVYSQSGKDHQESPRSAADGVMDLLTDKNSEESYGLLSKAYKEASTKEEWKAWVELAFADISGKATFVKELPIEQAGDTYGKNVTPTRYVYAFRIEDKTYQVPFVFINESGAWKLAEIGSPIQ